MKKLKILLIKPYIATDEIQPPLGLGYLATTVRDKHNVRIIDGIKEKLQIIDFNKEVERGKYDVIGIQCYTFDKHLVKQIIENIRSISPNIVTIVGGPHPSADIESVYNYLGADFGFKGEAEIGFPLLINKIAGDVIDLKDIPSLIWKNDHNFYVNEQKFVENLDDLGHPSWDLLKPNTYPQAPHGAFFKKYPIAPIFATRGCPYQCTFCAGFLISGRKIRYRSVENFVDEIETLHKDYGINEFHIEDDNFSFSRDFVVKFCNELMKRHLDIAWACPNGMRLDSLDQELISLMKKSGLYVVSVGIESGSERILREMRKNLSKKQITEKLNLISKQKVDLVGFFIVGYPGETIKDINDTIDFACSLPLKRASFMAFKPFPGTEATKRIIDEINVENIDNKNFALHKIAYAPKGITPKMLKRLRRKALIKFYLRPKIAWGLIISINSFSHFKFIFKRVFNWLTK